jgi:hypothetical protein
VPCPVGQVCQGNHCALGGGGGCSPDCDGECVVMAPNGTCATVPDGTPCHGASGMTCQKCLCGR